MKYFSKDHEWVEIEDTTATVGISIHAAEELGDITFVEIPEVDSDISKGDVISVVESVKAASDIYCPTTGTISEVNEELDDSPELINEDAEGKGWICKISGVDSSVTKDLMNPEQYQEFLKK